MTKRLRRPEPDRSNQGISAPAHVNWRLSWVVVILITLKSVYLGWFVIPPGDIPDESGHYAYVHDIAKGSVFPLLEKATIPNNLWMDPPAAEQANPSPPRVNYIVQHPPLYYVVAAAPLAVAKLVSDDRWYHIRFTRLVSALSLGLVVWVVFKMLLDLGVRSDRALLMSASIAMVPTMSNLSAGITNDVFLVLMCALSTRYFVRYVLHQRLPDAYLCAAWLTAAGATKMTAWMLIAAYVAILVFELRGPIGRWLLHAAGISLTALAAPLWWMGRNLYHFGDPFYIMLGLSQKALPDATLMQFLESQPFFYFMLVHFYALFGFSGYCQTPELAHLCIGNKITHVNNEPFFFFVGVLCLLSLAAVIWTWRHAWHAFRQPPGPVVVNSLQTWTRSLLSGRATKTTLLGAALVLGLAAYLPLVMRVHWEPGFIAGPLVSALGWAPLLVIPYALVAVLVTPKADERAIFYCLLGFAFFAVIFMLQTHKAYVWVGQLRGVQGRYFFPYIPALLAAAGFMMERLRVPTQAYLWIALGLALGEIYSYVQHVIPFFESVKI